MSKRSFALRAMSAGLALGAVALAHCGSTPEPLGVNSTTEDIIGGVSAESPALDAVGALAMVYENMPYPGYAEDAGSNSKPGYEDDGGVKPVPSVYPFCSATLIGPQTVLTAKHCVQGFGFGYGASMVFALGPDTSAPRRTVRIVEVETLGEPQVGGMLGLGADLAVAHLEEKIVDVTPQKLGRITDRMIGRRIVAVGYGLRNNSWQYGQRRLGGVTVRLTSGKVFEEMFGGFDAFKKWAQSVGYYGKYSYFPNGMQNPNTEPYPFKTGAVPTSPLVTSTDAGPGGYGDAYEPTDSAIPPYEDGAPRDATPVYDTAVADGDPIFDSGPSFDTGPGWDTGPVYDPLLEAYETTLVADSEVYVGGKSGDAQPCRGDSGGPIMGKASDGSVRVFGVASWALRSQKNECDFGAVYATFSAANLEWLKKAANWVDPCKDITSRGTCEGNVVVRCTEPSEGARRLTRANCSELNLSCGYGTEGATCK